MSLSGCCSITIAILLRELLSKFPLASTYIPLGRRKSGVYMCFVWGTTYGILSLSYSNLTPAAFRADAIFFSNPDLYAFTGLFFTCFFIVPPLQSVIFEGLAFFSEDEQERSYFIVGTLPIILILLLVVLYDFILNER